MPSDNLLRVAEFINRQLDLENQPEQMLCTSEPGVWMNVVPMLKGNIPGHNRIIAITAIYLPVETVGATLEIPYIGQSIEWDVVGSAKVPIEDVLAEARHIPRTILPQFHSSGDERYIHHQSRKITYQGQDYIRWEPLTPFIPSETYCSTKLIIVPEDLTALAELAYETHNKLYDPTDKTHNKLYDPTDKWVDTNDGTGRSLCVYSRRLTSINERVIYQDRDA